MFSGVFTALITPMAGDGTVDLSRLAEFVEFQISEGIDGLVPCGTTGETPTLSLDEQASIIRTVVERAKGRVPVIAGAGTNATAQAIAASKMAAELGVDALLHVTPYYSKPTQSNLIAHFRAICDAVQLPIVLYNVPGRTGCDLLPETVATLAEWPQIAAVKEATGSIARGQDVYDACRDHQIVLLSGDDATTFALTAIGGKGAISVVSNLVPRAMSEMVRKALGGAVAEAREAHYRLLPLMKLTFLESNPIPVKAGASLMGYTDNVLRLPLQAFDEQKLALLRAEMTRLGLLG